MHSEHAAARGTSIAVIGAGMLGLTLALRLAETGFRVTVHEGAPEVGGLTQFTSSGGVSWDRFYHVIDASDQALLSLLAELELAGDVQWRTTATLLYDGRQHHPLNNVMDYLQLPVLSLLDKIRVATNILYAGARAQGHALEAIEAERWLTRWSGRKAYQQLWAPLLRTKLGRNYDRVSAAFIWSVIRRFYGARQGSKRTEQFGFMPGGYARILATLLTRLRQLNVIIVTDSRVESVEHREPTGLTLTRSGTTEHYDRIVVTAAGPVAAAMCRTLPKAERERHHTLSYQGVVCLSLLLNRPLGGAYMTYITDESVPFTTVIEMSSLTGTAPFGDHHLVYLPRYVPAEDAFLQSPDDEVKAEFLQGLARLYPDFDDSQIVASHIARAPYVMALPVRGYSQHLPPMFTSIDGLTVCNSAQIVNASLSVNETVALANRGAAAIING